MLLDLGIHLDNTIHNLNTVHSWLGNIPFLSISVHHGKYFIPDYLNCVDWKGLWNLFSFTKKMAFTLIIFLPLSEGWKTRTMTLGSCTCTRILISITHFTLLHFQPIRVLIKHWTQMAKTKIIATQKSESDLKTNPESPLPDFLFCILATLTPHI